MASHFNVIAGRAAMIASESLSREAMIENARTIQVQADQAVGLLDRLASAAVEESVPEPPWCDVRAVLRDADFWLRIHAPELATRVVVELPEAAKMVGAKHTSLFALVSLCEAAVDTLIEPHAIRLYARCEPVPFDEDSRGGVRLVFALEWPSDRGEDLVRAGASDALLEAPERVGTFLPVVLARKVARLHGGDLLIDASTKGTARCELRWPLAVAP